MSYYQSYALACPRGHVYEGENLYLTPDGRRQCRTCRKQANQAWRRRKAENAWKVRA